MKTILVPTDFSKASKVAVLFAVGIAKEIGAKVILLSVINGGASTMSNWKKIERELVRTAQQEADKLLDEIKRESGATTIVYRSILGFPVEEMIEQFAVDNKVDFIVMGTKGATGLKKAFMGSNTAAVIDKSSVPVMVVPEDAQFKHLRKMVYATDLSDLSSELKSVTTFAHLFDAHIHVLHVAQDSTKRGEKELEKDIDLISRKEEIKQKPKYSKIQVHLLKGNKVADRVNKFAVEQKADLLILFTHRLDFYEKLFGKSVARQLAFHNQIPLLTFNKTNN